MSRRKSAHELSPAQYSASVMNSRSSPYQGETQVLRDDASPLGVNCICQMRRGSHGFSGLAPHFGRSSFPRSVHLCSGVPKTSLPKPPLGPISPRQPLSIGKTQKGVNHLSGGKIALIFSPFQRHHLAKFQVLLLPIRRFHQPLRCSIANWQRLSPLPRPL
jgi:hypothetical protein